MGFVMGASTLYGDRVKFGCEKGYFLRGEAKAICNESGVWSAQVPACERESLAFFFAAKI